tara:strand:- start:1245 stop:1454 length:210 start_codon:yes stop_codon:yes gene_type:complete
MKCKKCDKPLRLIGIDRKNGIPIKNSSGKDWTTNSNKPREYHKKCYRELKEEREFYLKYLEEKDKVKTI